MASLDEVRVAAFRIQESADGLAQRLQAASGELRQKGQQLTQVVGRNSRSGTDAIQQVSQAERQLMDSAAKLQALKRQIQALLADLAQ